MDQDPAKAQHRQPFKTSSQVSLADRTLLLEQALEDGPRTPLSDSSQASLEPQNLVLTPSSVLVEQTNPFDDKFGVELTPRTQRANEEKAAAQAAFYAGLIPLGDSQKQLNSHSDVRGVSRAHAAHQFATQTHNPFIANKAEEKLQALINNGGKAEMSNSPIANIRAKKTTPSRMKIDSTKSLTSAKAGGPLSPIKKLWGKVSAPFSSSHSGHNVNDPAADLTPIWIESAKAAQILGTRSWNSLNDRVRATASDDLYTSDEVYRAAIAGPSYTAKSMNNRGDVRHPRSSEHAASIQSTSVPSLLKYYNDELPPTPPSKDVRRQDPQKKSVTYSPDKTVSPQKKTDARSHAKAGSSDHQNYQIRQGQYLAKYPVVRESPFESDNARVSSHVTHHNPPTPPAQEQIPEMVQRSTKSLTRGEPTRKDKPHGLHLGHRPTHSLSHLSAMPAPLNPSIVTRSDIDYAGTSNSTNTLAATTFDRDSGPLNAVDHEPELANPFENQADEITTTPDMQSGAVHFDYPSEPSANPSPSSFPATGTNGFLGPASHTAHTRPDNASSNTTTSEAENPHSPPNIIFMAGQVFGALLTRTNNRLETIAGHVDLLAQNVGTLAKNVDTLSKNVHHLDRHTNSIDKRIDHWSKSLDGSLKLLSDSADGNLEYVQGRFDAIDKHVDALEKRLESSTARLGTVEKRLNAIEGRLGNIAAEQTKVVELLGGLQMQKGGSGSGTGAAGGGGGSGRAAPDLAMHPYYKGQGQKQEQGQ